MTQQTTALNTVGVECGLSEVKEGDGALHTERIIRVRIHAKLVCDKA